MKKMLIAYALVLLAGAAHAQQGPQIDVADGADPVLLMQGKDVLGKPELKVERNGFTYLFSTPETKAIFEREPQKYEVQLGGLCARMGGTTTGDPANFAVHDGRLYLFGSDECRKAFLASPSRYLPPAAKPLAPTPNVTARGRALVDKAVAALGGDALRALTSFVQKISLVDKRPQGDVPVTLTMMWRFPHDVRVERTATMMDRVMSSANIVTSDRAWFEARDRSYPTAPAGRPSLERAFGRQLVPLLHAHRLSAFTAVAEEPETIDGKPADRVRIQYGATDVTLGIDQESGRVLTSTYVDRNQEGIWGTFTLRFSDFRNVDGLTIPFTQTASFEGKPYAPMTWTLTAVQVNPSLDPSLFTMKGAQ